MSFRVNKVFARSLAMVPAAFVLYSGAATAANSVDDLLEQTRAVLSGKPAVVSRVSGAQPSTTETRSGNNAQESARRVLLGDTTRPPSLPAAGVSGAKGKQAYDDVQAQAQRLLLGRR